MRRRNHTQRRWRASNKIHRQTRARSDIAVDIAQLIQGMNRPTHVRVRVFMGRAHDGAYLRGGQRYRHRTHYIKDEFLTPVIGLW